ncbi:MAG: low affinity iron permease family protein [Alphaproteobacteria bacterium]|nr:low affinity iron permease family protein [Alphaproteobacteria bacterium]
MDIQQRFSNFAKYSARLSGHPDCFLLACGVVLVWLVLGHFFSFSDTWQLVINTGTTIVTFLMVFLIQNVQNRDGEAIHIKLDELIRVQRGAHNSLLDLEELTERQLDHIKNKYEELARISRDELIKGKKDTRKVGS